MTVQSENSIRRILRLGYYPVSAECAGAGAQIVDGNWYMPRWGCDTIQHIMDVLDGDGRMTHCRLSSTAMDKPIVSDMGLG